MIFRIFPIAGEDLISPAYIHRMVDGWRISLAGFTRSWADTAHNGASGALKEAVKLLELILEQDEKTLRELFNASVEIRAHIDSNTVRAYAFIIDSKKLRMQVPLRHYRTIPNSLVGVRFNIDDKAYFDYIGQQNIDTVFETWKTELRRSFKRTWTKDILEFIKKHYPANSCNQLSLI